MVSPPLREVGPTACRCCAAPCRRWRRYQYSIIRHASQGCCCLAGRGFFVEQPAKKHVVGAHSVRPWVFGQCAAMARRGMQRKVRGRTMFAPTCSTAQKTDKKHVVGAHSVRPRAFGQCATMARRRMQRKVGGRTMFAPTCSTAQKTDKKHVVGAYSVRPWAFGQCAAMARRRMQRKVGGRTMFAPTCSTA